MIGKIKLILAPWSKDDPIRDPDPKRHDFSIRAYDGPKEVGSVLINLVGRKISAELWVNASYRRKGLATAMFDWAEELSGREAVPSSEDTEETFEDRLSKDAQKFWLNRWKAKGETKLLRAISKVIHAKATSLTVYRGTKDILPNKVDHKFKGDGIFGKGTYFSLSESYAEQYATGAIGFKGFVNFGIIYTYSVSGNFLTLTPKNTAGLGAHHEFVTFLKDDVVEGYEVEDDIPRDQVSELVGWNFDAVLLTDPKSGGQESIDGGDQLIIPFDSSLKPKPTGMDILFYDDDLAEAFAKKIGSNVREENVPTVNIELRQTSKASAILTKMFAGAIK